MTVALQLQIPTGCSGRELSPEPAAGASYAAHETNGMSRYVVVVGDTLYSISRQYALPLKLLMDANNIDNPDRLLVGQTLLIPGEPVEQYVVDSSSSIQETAAAPRTVSSVGDVAAGALGPNNAQVAATSDISQLDLTPGTVVLPAPASGSASIDGSLTDNTAQGLPLSAGVFIAPASGRIDTFFEEGRSNGIRVVVDNRAVRAISDGIVLYSDFHSEYKDLIILRHEGGFVSVYYNLFTREVKKGDEVIRGKILGAARETIYFELREGGVPIDPLPLVGTAIWQ